MTSLSLAASIRSDPAATAWPYPSAANAASSREATPEALKVNIRALPYYAWANRAGLGMRIWLPIHSKESTCRPLLQWLAQRPESSRKREAALVGYEYMRFGLQLMKQGMMKDLVNGQYFMDDQPYTIFEEVDVPPYTEQGGCYGSSISTLRAIFRFHPEQAYLMSAAAELTGCDVY